MAHRVVPTKVRYGHTTQVFNILSMGLICLLAVATLLFHLGFVFNMDLNLVAFVQLILAFVALVLMVRGFDTDVSWTTVTTTNATKSWHPWSPCMNGACEKEKELYPDSDCRGLLYSTRVLLLFTAAFWVGLIVYTIWMLLSYQAIVLSRWLRVVGHAYAWIALLLTMSTWIVWLIFVGDEGCHHTGTDLSVSHDIGWILVIVSSGMCTSPYAHTWTRVYFDKGSFTCPIQSTKF